MKLAITADVHLQSGAQTPERWSVLRDIFKQSKKQKIENLIIAGDLFDKESYNYSKFDRACSKQRDLQIHLVPGNHDAELKQSDFTSKNIKVYEQPEIINLNGLKFFFVPFKADKTMANVLAEFSDQLSQPWVLIGHGNWAETIRSRNPVEPGVYMPLSRNVVKQYQPSLTILGHIHKMIDNNEYRVYYPGSPIGLDITETGRRSFLTLNLDSLEVDRQELDPEVIYFDEEIFVYPMENEKEYWQDKAKEIQQKWGLTKKEKNKAVIRLNISGFSSNKRRLKSFFKQEFSDFQGWKDNKIDVSQVNSATDNYELLKISQQITQKINNLDLEEQDGQPTKNEIIVQAMKTIYIR